MQPVLLDTNIVSFLLRRDTRAGLYAEELRDKRLCLCFMTVAELQFGARIARWGAARLLALEQALSHYVILPFDHATVSAWVEVAVHQRRAGRGNQYCNDWWIAAAAIRHSLPLVTHDATDFEGIPRLEIVTRS